MAATGEEAAPGGPDGGALLVRLARGSSKGSKGSKGSKEGGHGGRGADGEVGGAAEGGAGQAGADSGGGGGAAAERPGGEEVWAPPRPRGACDFYMREGRCTLGGGCRFRHAGRPRDPPLMRAIAGVLRGAGFAVGRRAASAATGRQVSESGREEAALVMQQLVAEAPGWELAEVRVRRLLLQVVGRPRGERDG